MKASLSSKRELSLGEASFHKKLLIRTVVYSENKTPLAQETQAQIRARASDQYQSLSTRFYRDWKKMMLKFI